MRALSVYNDDFWLLSRSIPTPHLDDGDVVIIVCGPFALYPCSGFILLLDDLILRFSLPACQSHRCYNLMHTYLSHTPQQLPYLRWTKFFFGSIL
jgi:hypothetical protein